MEFFYTDSGLSSSISVSILCLILAEVIKAWKGQQKEQQKPAAFEMQKRVC